jgi:hypothetical protein
MVPLRIDVINVRPSSADALLRPRLVLKDFTSKDLTYEAPPQRQLRTNSLRKLENIFAFIAAAAVLLYFMVGFGVSLFHTVQSSYSPVSTPTMLMISKTVKHGDTLSRFASRYGDSNTYILDREEQIARVNHLSGFAPLLPGQHLLIPVTSPTIIAQIEQSYHRTRVASR